MRTVSLALSTALLTPAASADLLLDFGIADPPPGAFGVYQRVSSPDIDNGFHHFQPFDVTVDDGWRIDRIEIFGRYSGSPTPNILGTIRLSLHTWTGTLDSLSGPLAEGVVEMPYEPGAFAGAWVGFDIDPIDLPEDSYIIRATPATPQSVASWHYGRSGPPSITLRLSDDQQFNRDVSTALRIYGTPIPAPATVSLLALGLAGTRRRR